jgi:hypothetical protein
MCCLSYTHRQYAVAIHPWPCELQLQQVGRVHVGDCNNCIGNFFNFACLQFEFLSSLRSQ